MNRRALVEEAGQLLAGIEDLIPDEFDVLGVRVVEGDPRQDDVFFRVFSLPATDGVQGQVPGRQTQNDSL